jgi:hypothetical protein
MIEKFAGVCGLVRSEFLDLNHTRKSMILVSRCSLPTKRLAPANFEIGTLGAKPFLRNLGRGNYGVTIIGIQAPRSSQT